ncbi:MAG: hypothetical protein LUF78_09385 [Clostridiales bacterium]|nr:hypothetical protein [Clostridiales bacterium]
MIPCKSCRQELQGGTVFIRDADNPGLFVFRMKNIPPLYIGVLQKISYVEYILDEVFLNGSVEEKTDFVRANENKIAELENRIQRLDPEEEKLSDLSIAI